MDKKLEEYFKKDKLSWFTTNTAGEQIWNKELVKDFWSKIRKHKTGVDDYEFKDYIFPEFENRRHYIKISEDIKRERSFWKKDEPYEFKKSIYFNNCTFLGYTDFQNVNFEQNARFTSVNFCHETNFNFAIFNEDSSFSRCKYNGIAIYFKTKFNKETYFYKTQFISEVYFIQTEFNTAIFKQIFIGENELLFEKIINNSFPSVTFIDSRLNSNVVFRKIDMRPISFIKTDIGNVKFLHCVWLGENRIKLNSENHTNNDSLFREDIMITYSDLEDTYRQLKKNFDFTKNWELSGYAYVSEMHMREKRLWNEENYYYWFLYWFYGYFSGYTQDVKKPILSLVGLISIFSLLFYFIDQDMTSAIQRSFKGAIPYFEIGIEKPFEGYWLVLKNIETVLGGTFLAFFILALRKRFKQ